MIGVPPLLVGAPNLTVMDAKPVIADTAVGAVSDPAVAVIANPRPQSLK